VGRIPWPHRYCVYVQYRSKLTAVRKCNCDENIEKYRLTAASDPADELIREAAVNGQAEAIVTHNARDFHPAFRMFGMPVKSPAQALKALSK
jgi:hypothetical protein